MSATAVPDEPARIGPNAIIRVVDALRAGPFARSTEEILALAGLDRYGSEPPDGMVVEEEVMALHRVLRERLGQRDGAAVAREAGERTARYLLAHRIPRLVQWLLRRLPPGPAARIFLRAIERHAWTFSGSGRFAWEAGIPTRLTIADSPLARELRSDVPVCDYYAGTFEALFRALVHPASRAREVACEATGAPACSFEIRWD